MLRVMKISSSGFNDIGDIAVQTLAALRDEKPYDRQWKIVAVIPIMLSSTSSFPPSFIVTKAQLIVDDGQ